MTPERRKLMIVEVRITFRPYPRTDGGPDDRAVIQAAAQT